MAPPIRFVLSVIVLCAGLTPALAEPLFELSGFVAGDLRLFPHHAIQLGQDNQRLNPSLVLNPEFLWQWNNGDDRIEYIPFARLDSHDGERSHGDIRQLSYSHIDDGWDLTGVSTKYFGASWNPAIGWITSTRPTGWRMWMGKTSWASPCSTLVCNGTGVI
jgi:hypothetical protein